MSFSCCLVGERPSVVTEETLTSNLCLLTRQQIFIAADNWKENLSSHFFFYLYTKITNHVASVGFTICTAHDPLRPWTLDSSEKKSISFLIEILIFKG